MPDLKSIIILNSSGLSEVMLTTPLIAALKRAHPEARLDYAISAHARAALTAHPQIETRIEVGQLNNPLELIKLMRFFSAHHYDAIFIAHAPPQVAAAARVSGIKIRVGFNNGSCTHSVEAKVVKHQAELYLDLAQALNIDTEGFTTTYTPPAEAQRAVLPLLSENKILDKQFILLHVGGTNGKRWLPANFSQLAMRLMRESGRPVALVAHTSEEAILETVRGLINLPVINLGARSLDEIGAIAARCELYVGTDTGATHIAVGTGTRVLMIMGPSDPKRWAPYGDPKAVTYVWRNPNHGKANGQGEVTSFNWSDGITVEETTLACLRLLIRGEQLAFRL